MNGTKLRQWIGRLSGKPKQSYPDYRTEQFLQRFQTVQQRLAECLDAAPCGRVLVLSICAGDGGDMLGVLKWHPRQSDVSAWLIESNVEAVAEGNRQANGAGLQNHMHFLKKDATEYATYQSIPPANIVLLCGVWGHVPKLQRGQLVTALSALCKPGGEIIWTRGIAKGTAPLQEIQALFDRSIWIDRGIRITTDNRWAIATYRFCGAPSILPEHGRIFNFRGGIGAR